MGDKSPKAKLKQQKEKDIAKAKSIAEAQKLRDAKSQGNAKTATK